MPIARISLRAGKSPSFLRAISDSLHQAMIETFDVPPDDRFHVFHQHAAYELIFDRNYQSLHLPRTDNFVLFSITAGRERSATSKQALYRRLTERLAQSPGIAANDVMVVVSTTLPEDWSFADGVTAPIRPPSQVESAAR